jgi:hypothetical protein
MTMAEALGVIGPSCHSTAVPHERLEGLDKRELRVELDAI